MGKLFSPSKPENAKQRRLQRSPPSQGFTLDKIFAEACIAEGSNIPRSQVPCREKQITKHTFSSQQSEQKLGTHFNNAGALRQKKLIELLNSQPAPSGFRLNSPGLRQTRLRFDVNFTDIKPSAGSITTASHLSPRNARDSFSFEQPMQMAPPSAVAFFDPEFNERFCIGRVLGHGAFAAVRECECRLTGRRAAVKSYRYALQGGVLDRVVQNEIRVLRAARHQNIVELLGVVRTRSYTHIILELFEGETLEQKLQRSGGRLPAEECHRVFSQILAAVLYLHRQKLYHRDLKVENIMLDEKCRVKIIDFGFAFDATQPGLPPLICGTPNYMAPEAVDAVPAVPAAAEAWALGVLLHRLFCGAFPFQPEKSNDPGSRLVYIYRRPSDISDSLHNLFTSLFELNATERLPLDRIAAHSWLIQSNEQ